MHFQLDDESPGDENLRTDTARADANRNREARDHLAAELNEALQSASPTQIIRAAQSAVPKGRLAVTSSFGAESALLLKCVANVDAAIPVLFLDTGWLFEETLTYRDTLVARLGLSDIRVLKPDSPAAAARDAERDLWFRDPDACCSLRKVEPLSRALEPFEGWINGRKRFHGHARSHIPVVESDGLRLKFNPLAHVTQEEVRQSFTQFDLPRHPLEQAGYASIGCMPCTSRVSAGQSVRDGRWQGRGKTECGIHQAPESSKG